MESPKRILLCKALVDRHGIYQLDRYCTHIQIAMIGTGTAIGLKGANDFESDDLARNGTLTFLEYKGRYYGITCRHVLDALQNANSKYKHQFKADMGMELDHDRYQFYTPIGRTSHHFNYILWPVPEASPEQPDIAIAEIPHEYIKKVGKRPLKLTDRKTLPRGGLACGYPEQQRKTRPSSNSLLETVVYSSVHCLASMEIQNRDLVLSDVIDEHFGVNNLSGMSGGPIVWSDSSSFGLAGIVKRGWDLQPTQMESTKPGITIFGERITPELFDGWIKEMPRQKVIERRDHFIYVPSKK